MNRGTSFGVGIIQGEVSLLLSAARRGSRWNSHGISEEDQDPLILSLYQLQDKLNHTQDLYSLGVMDFIKPFCQIVQSDDTTGPVTGLAIASLQKFLAYNLISPAHPSAPGAIEALSVAVARARFVGTDPASDEAVLMKIVHVFRTLLLSPVGRLLTNESVFEIMHSCFRICFEITLSELLRCFAESTLVDLIQLLFTRLAEFSEDGEDATSSNGEQASGTPSSHQEDPSLSPNRDPTNEAPSPSTSTTDAPSSLTPDAPPPLNSSTDAPPPLNSTADAPSPLNSPGTELEKSQGVEENAGSEKEKAVLAEKEDLIPYGLPCVRELTSFLISIISTDEGQANSDSLVGIGLNLITVVLECGSSHIGSFAALVVLVQDNLCKCLFQLLKHDSFILFSRALRCCSLLFQGCRRFLKLQLEVFMNNLMDLIYLEGSSDVIYDKRQLAMESVVQLCNKPHFPAELYVNFDCGLYCSSVFENLTKVLSKNAFPTQGAISSIHILSLDALLAIASNLETDSHVTSLALGDHQTEDNNKVIGSLSNNISGPLVKESWQSGFSDSPDFELLKPASGYQSGLLREGIKGGKKKETHIFPVIPDSQELLRIRQKKKLILAATEEFNKKPKHGITFLMEQGILSTPLDPLEVAGFFLENPGLNKAKIGDYIGERNNSHILEAFVSKHSLHNVPMVDALRGFLESFRLPGESPIVERILAVFSQHWLDDNAGSGSLGEMFANKDSVHVLTYSIMMLNTDLHSTRIKNKMTFKEFKRNQRGTNNAMDYPESFLMETYNKIKDEEIIMPDEHTGTVRENYQWKVLIHRSSTAEGEFMSVSSGEFDHDLFLLSWGPTIAALSSIYDNADDKTIAQKAIGGFSKCASVAAHYEVKEVFDNIIVALCKFTTLLNNHENSSSIYFLLGVNPKVRQSAQTMFSLAHAHGNILREGWKDLLDSILALFKARLLPEQMVEVFDFLHPNGKASLFRDETPMRNDSSLLSSLYNYLSSGQESGPSPSGASASGSGGGVGGRSLSTSEGKARSAALKCIEECHPELLFAESKFLRSDALSELVKALIFASRGPDHHETLGTLFDEDAAVFFLEVLVTVVIENRDRMNLFWKDVFSHLSRIVASAANTSRPYLLERGVVSLLHLVLRLFGRDGDSPVNQVLSSLQTVLFSLPPPSKPSLLYRQISNGLNDLVHTHGSSLSTSHQWVIIFSMLEFAGFGFKNAEVNVVNTFDLLDGNGLPEHEPQAFFKVCECLSFIVRSDHLVTFANFNACVRCARHFTEVASSKVALEHDKLQTKPLKSPGGRREKANNKRGNKGEGKAVSTESNITYASSLIKLLDLLDALYFKVGRIFDDQALSALRSELGAGGKEEEEVMKNGEGYSPEADAIVIKRGCNGGKDFSDSPLMWEIAWCPLLQGMARMCCDSRRSVRQTSITYLQRALLSHDLHHLTGQEWGACFNQIFFPMLTRLLEGMGQTRDKLSLEETRVRACNLLCKVFLQHLPSLLTDSFDHLWMEILLYMEKFLHLDNSELLCDAIPESLKNMLLVMSTQGVFDNAALNNMNQSDPSFLLGKGIDPQKLWSVTWNRIEEFLPNFLSELFPDKSPMNGKNGTLSKAEKNVSGPDTSNKDISERDEGNKNKSVSPPSTEVGVVKDVGVANSASTTGESPEHSLQSSPLHVTSAIPPRLSPSHVSSSPSSTSSPSHTSAPDTSPSPERDPAFPIILHPPLPPTITSETIPLPGSQNQTPDPSPPPSMNMASSRLDNPSPLSTTVQQHLVHQSGPILGPPAPPYAGSNTDIHGIELVSVNNSSTTPGLQPVQFSPVSSI